MVQRTYYPPREDDDTPTKHYQCAREGCKAVSEDRYCRRCSRRLGLVRHGITLADLDGMARAAVVADRLLAMPSDERYAIAWSAIAEAVCAAETTPDRRWLVQTGWQAIARHVRDGLRQRGYADGERWSSEQPTMARFVRFWGRGVAPSPEDDVVDRIAVMQVMAVLGEPYYDAVLALAVHDDYAAAAAALGVRYSTLTVRLSTARRHLLKYWHQGETPHLVRRTDRRVEVRNVELATHCSAGHEWTPENTRFRNDMVRGRVKRSRACRACEVAHRARRKAANQRRSTA
jgi:DNA-directed RNA polymerase specialized sigma24 family protein